MHRIASLLSLRGLQEKSPKQTVKTLTKEGYTSTVRCNLAPPAAFALVLGLVDQTSHMHVLQKQTQTRLVLLTTFRVRHQDKVILSGLQVF